MAAMEQVVAELEKVLDAEQLKINEPLKGYTSFKIGGPCDYFIEPNTVHQVQECIRIFNQFNIDMFILGNGSNLLVTDKGFRGGILHLYNNFNEIHIDGQTITAQTGITLASLASKAARSGLAGLEFASGIPGTLGGAVFMNAGAYGGEMKQVVESVKAVTKNGEVKEYGLKEMGLEYRHSAFHETGDIVLEVTMKLVSGNKQAIYEEMKTLNSRRKEKQPLEYPSAGSTFKRPEGHFAGKLIMDAGLAGYHIGDACVSPKHCGFVINRGSASFKDVYDLILHIQKTVKEKFGVELEREVKILGEL